MFPAEASGGTAWLKSVAAPLPEAKFCPTGGIDAKNLASYLGCPNVLAVGGSWVAPKDAIAIILTWMMGYLQDSDEPAVINFTKMEALGTKLKTYCDKNPTHALMTALDKVTDEDSK